MAKKETTHEDPSMETVPTPAIEMNDQPIEEAPSIPVGDGEQPMATPTATATAEEVSQEATLSELKLLAEKRGPVGPAARPGRFAPRRAGTIHSVDNNVRVEDVEARERKLAQITLYQSFVNKRVLSGNVIGVRPAFDRGSPNKMHYYVIVPNGPYQVYIPVEKFTDTDMEELCKSYQRNDPSKTVEDATKIYLQSRLGAEIEYVVTNLPEDGDLENSMVVGGNRVEAMRRNRIHFWFGTTTAGTNLININDKAQARVIAVARSGIRVEIFGVESFIRSRDLAWNMIQDAAEYFSVGDRVTVLITDIKRDMDNDYAVEFSASVKLAAPDPRDNGLRLFADGGIYTGVINYIRVPEMDDNRRPAVFVKLADGVQCMCPFPNGTVAPAQGSKVYVRITNHDDQRKFLFGRITHMLKN